MKISTSIFLRTIVWLAAFFALLALGYFVPKLELHLFWMTFGSLFVIFLAQGFASLIPTRKEIRDRQQSI